MKYRDHLRICLPVSDVMSYASHVKYRRRKIAFERERRDAEDDLDFIQLDRNVDAERLLLSGHLKFLS